MNTPISMLLLRTKTQNGEAMSDLLLPEIWCLILTKLPVKSILLCRCVCKTWYSLISSPYFISAQSLNNSTSDRVLVHAIVDLLDPFIFSSHDESFVESHEHHDLPELFMRAKIVGSCNGLVCLLSQQDVNLDSVVQRFLIWNPSIRKQVELPFCSSSSSVKMRYIMGFGFDSSSGDYKVLRVVLLDSDSDLVPVTTEIFDLRNGAWRNLNSPRTQCPRPFKVPFIFHSCVDLNGTLHWMANEVSSDCFLLSFNLSSEVFGVIEIPCGVEFKGSRDYHEYAKVLPINGLLSVALLSSRLQTNVHCSVWSMKEYDVPESWTKLFHIELPTTMHYFGLLGFWENGEVLVRDLDWDYNNNGVVALYNPESLHYEVLLSTYEHILDACYYRESLVLL